MDVKAKANIGTISIGGKSWDFPVYQGQNKRSQNKMKTLTQFMAFLAIGLLASLNTLRAAEPNDAATYTLIFKKVALRMPKPLSVNVLPSI